MGAPITRSVNSAKAGVLSAAAVTRSRSESSPFTLPCPSFSYCLASNQRSHPAGRLQPGKMSLFCAWVEAFNRVGLLVQ